LVRKVFGVDARPAKVALGVLIAVKLAILFALAWNRRIVMDEFAQLGWSKYLGHGLFATVWPPKTVGFTVFIKLAHLIGWDAVSILLIGRMQTALLACGTLAIIYGCARALGETRVHAALILILLLSFSNFIERIFETRAEPLAVFFAAAALLVILRGRADQARTVVVAGVFSGLAFLTTQKSVYFNVALGLALVADAAVARGYLHGMRRGGSLVLGWALSVIAYCLVFGGSDPVPVAENLFFGPVEVATTGADAYGGLRHYVGQTLSRNALLYIFCFAGMALSLIRIRTLDASSRIALIFSVVIAALVFTHDQPWPYVFIIALPFMALWALKPLDLAAEDKRYFRIALLALGIAVAASFVRNLYYLQFDNRAQLALVERAESVTAPDEQYFDGVGMLPNRMEPSTLWLDRAAVLKTLRQGASSEAHRIFSETPPKILLWSYRMDAINPVIEPLIRTSYVQIAPNLRITGRRLRSGEPTSFNVLIAGTYALYDANGAPLNGRLQINGMMIEPPFHLARGAKTVILRSGSPNTLLLPQASYTGIIEPRMDNDRLFANVYD
jgi:hypothetical protein